MVIASGRMCRAVAVRDNAGGCFCGWLLGRVVAVAVEAEAHPLGEMSGHLGDGWIVPDHRRLQIELQVLLQANRELVSFQRVETQRAERLVRSDIGQSNIEGVGDLAAKISDERAAAVGGTLCSQFSAR